MSNVAEWLAALSGLGTLGVAIWVANTGIKSFTHQRKVNDVDFAFRLFSEINRYWDRLSEGSDNPQYEYGQILSYFEIAATLFNRGTLSKDATEILRDHIIEVFSGLQSTKEGRELLAHCRSAHTTFEELQAFAKEHFSKMLLAQSFGQETAQ